MKKAKNKTQLTSLKLSEYLDQLLLVDHFKDFCPNGLQVQGKKHIRLIVSGVTASRALIEKAIRMHADAILVHHGWFWKNDEQVITGQLHDRLKLLMDHEINLFAYHLPLDAHPTMGNNASLANELGFKTLGKAPHQELIFWGELGEDYAKGVNLVQLSVKIEGILKRKPLVIGKPNQKIKTIAWCTGAAQGYFKEAVKLGVDAYLSGEISEQTTHLARESGLAYIAAGHHATERYGVQSLGKHLQEHFGIAHHFIDIDNPV
jgi:dinuclear metal center YbgI/SA1388 family protein